MVPIVYFFRKHSYLVYVGPDADGSGIHSSVNYYQWIPFVLLFQGVLCYAPYYAWKRLQGQTIP